ncbi:hypothetical protein BDN72DRAFT_851611, partial [Pluteus cervinus]
SFLLLSAPQQYVLIHSTPTHNPAHDCASFIQVTDRVQGYYERFPPKSFNVAIEERPRPGHPAAKVVVLTQDVAAGETIYKEYPIVTALDPDVQSAGTHCTHCFRTIQPNLSLVLPLDADPLHSRFCSQACLVANKAQSHTILFSQDSPIPEELSIPIPIPEESKQARREAQDKYVAYLKKEGRTAPLLAARFIARQLAAETIKVAGGGKTRKLPGVENDYTDTDDTEYVLADHLERLKALDLDSVQPDEEELTLLVEVLKAGFPGLDEFVNDERYALMIAKMRFNSYGVCFDGGRDDRPVPTVPVEEMERTRTPHGTSRQIGSALYTLSSYLPHSCIPSARVSFTSGTTEIHVVANRDLKKGDEVTVAWVDVAQRVGSGESIVECRRRRRFELVRGWKFACGCQRCEDEAKVGEEKVKEVKKEGEEEDKTIGAINSVPIPKVDGELQTASEEAEPVEASSAIAEQPDSTEVQPPVVDEEVTQAGIIQA